MFEISGRITVKETGQASPNLVVAIFDADPAAISIAAVDTAVLESATIERIGSVLTDVQGRFQIKYEAQDFARADQEKRPDVMVAVFAPEDSRAEDPRPLPPRERLLHLSLSPRQDAGRQEAFAIRLLQAQLDRFGITAGDGATERNPEPFLKSVENAWMVRDAVKQRLQPRVKAEVDQRQKVREQASRLFKRVSRRRPGPGGEALFVSDTNALADAQHVAVSRGVERLQDYSGTLRLTLRQEDLRELNIEAGPAGERQVSVDGKRLFSMVRRRSGNPSLVRTHDLRQLLETCHATAPATGPGATSPTPESGPAEAPPPLTREQAERQILDRVIGQVAELSSVGAEDLPVRPDIEHIQNRLAALSIKSGPADTTAYHDFHVLQVAFKHVWMELFGEDLRTEAERLYAQWVRVRHDYGLDVPERDAIESVEEMREFLSSIGSDRDTWGDLLPVPSSVTRAYPEVTTAIWNELSLEQQQQIERYASDRSTDPGIKELGRYLVHQILERREGGLGRLERMLLEIGHRLNEPFAFDVFAPGSYNLGLLLTYRQRWDPVAYQVGDLVATIPLAPNETRKYTKRLNVKRTRSSHELDRALSSRAAESSDTLRADEEIVNKASTATNFKATAEGSFGLGIFDFSGTTEFSMNQAEESARVKKDFREAVRKASEEYKQERMIEVTTTSEDALEETTSGEITNPNNELTVTYLMFELQRRFRIAEHIHRATPVILVAQDMPYPHQIDLDWLLTHEWILRRVLLDDSFRAALDYIAEGVASDEFSIEVARSNWQTQKQLVATLETAATDQLRTRDALRAALIKTALGRDLADASESSTGEDVFAAVATGGLSLLFGGGDERATERQEAQRKAAETRLQYAEQALADAQTKLKSATETLTQATRDYTAALERQITRRNAVDQLRIHVKENILYYMQAIWDHEPPDQRFFRLYNKEITWFDPPEVVTLTLGAPSGAGDGRGVFDFARDASPTSIPGGDPFGLSPFAGTEVAIPLTISADLPRRTRTLVEVADLDRPIGYKGNYIVFPLKESNYLTTAMLQEFIHDYTSLWDPDEFGNYTTEELVELMRCVWDREGTTDAHRQTMREILERRLSAPRSAHDEVVVPTGQLFIEALPGKHALLEDFKLLHRVEDVRKVRAEVRNQELESLRLAARLVAGEREDPNVDKRVVIDKTTRTAEDT